jgi:NAD(P)-dependent dehydrogenase (short-subunit alcohol dehydrogenase family)
VLGVGEKGYGSIPEVNGLRTALITGAAKRIGAAIARDLASDGWAVAIHCNRSAAEADELAAEIRAAGGRAAIVTGDLADPAAVPRIVPTAVEALGPLTLLVNNASVFLEDRIGALEFGRWQTQFDVNLRAPVFLAEAFAAQLPDRAEGNIVNMIDQRVLKLTPEMTSYTLTKAALWAATRTLAQALAPRIRVNGIGPGPTFPNPKDGDAGMAKEAAGTLLGRPVDPADYGRAIRFLVETRSVTGAMIALDSGQHLAWRTPDIVGRP